MLNANYILKLGLKFEKGRKWIYVQRLRSITQQRLRELIRLNKTRREYMKRLQLMIDEYNAGRMDVVTIKDALYELPETYSDDLLDRKCELVYKHVYAGYHGEGVSVYEGT